MFFLTILALGPVLGTCTLWALLIAHAFGVAPGQAMVIALGFLGIVTAAFLGASPPEDH